MTSTFNRVFEVVKAHSIQTLVEYGESLPDEGAYNTMKHLKMTGRIKND